MPAIQPARLKQQAIDLALIFDQPTAFIRKLHALLDLYTDHTHRSGQAGEPLPLTGSYKAPAPVMRQVWVELNQQMNLHPECILPLCDALWAEANFDLQLLAARLLGQVPIEPPQPVLERLQSWVRADLNNRLLDGLLEHGLHQFRLQAPNQVLDLVAGWLASSDSVLKQVGLRLLLSLVNNSSPENLPAIIQLLTPYLRLTPSRLRSDVLAVLAALAQVSPAETAYAMRQSLSAPDHPDTAWLIRQVLDEFPEEMQKGLKDAMKSMSSSSSSSRQR
jgi:hypothetical protein